jgi:acetyltransferase-like isoleucine patch superfamily enzyme
LGISPSSFDLVPAGEQDRGDQVIEPETAGEGTSVGLRRRWTRTGRLLRRDLRQSPTPLRDAAQLVGAILFRPRGLWISSRVRLSNAGVIESSGPIRFGIFTNQMFVAPRDLGSLVVRDGGRVAAGIDVRIAQSCRIQVTGELQLGDRVRLNHSCKVLASQRISIGDDTLVGPETTIMDDDLHLIRSGSSDTSSAPISIGRNVWIGAGCSILKGVHIGDGAVVAANSVVTRSVPPGTLVAGAPAVVRRHDADWTP